MRIAAFSAFTFAMVLSAPAQVVIQDTREATPTPAPQPTRRPTAPVPSEPRAGTSGISIEPAGPTTATLRTDDPITITPAPGSRVRRTPPAAAPTPPPSTPMPPPEALAPPVVDAAPFLPPAEPGAPSTTTQRGGVTLPLRPEMLQSKPLDLTVPDVQETTLSNGMRLYHYESRELPRVSVAMLINAGERLDPANKTGLSDLTARTLRAGGAGALMGDDLDRALEQIGSELEISANPEYVSANLFALKENAPRAFALLGDVITSPAFAAAKLEQQRDLMIEELRRQNDDPGDIGRREFRKLVYGKENPLARTPTSASLHAITRDDVLGFYRNYYRPPSISIGVAGDISLDEAVRLTEETFRGWNPGPAQLPPPPVVDAARDTTSGVFLIRKPTAQSQVRLGHLGIPRHSPEQYAITVLNNVFGTGGFSSRLMNTVRTKHGYAYGTGGALQSDTPTGLFFAAAASKAKTTAAAIRAIIEVTNGLLSGAISADEIETAKRDTIFSFFAGLDTPAEIVWTHLYYDFLGYPEDYLEQYPDRIRAVEEQDMLAAAKKYIHPDRLKILVVGDPAEFDAPLQEFGPVQEIQLEHVEPDTASGPAGDE